MEGYNRALDDVVVLIKTSSDVSCLEDLVDRLEKSKIKNINDFRGGLW